MATHSSMTDLLKLTIMETAHLTVAAQHVIDRHNERK